MAASALIEIGALLADRTRATLLTALMDGRARTAGELARHARVAPSTVSAHLARLVDAGLLHVVSQGRHRYFRIADAETARLLERIGGFETQRAGDAPPVRAPDALRQARSCYDHLAGRLAVRLHDRLLDAGHVVRVDGHLALASSGAALLRDLGAADWAGAPSRPPLRACLDWTERRDHLAGPAAAALFTALLGRGWLAHGTRPRSVRLTEAGRRGLGDVLGPW